MKWIYTLIFGCLASVMLQAQEEGYFEPPGSEERTIVDFTIEMEMGFPIRNFKTKMEKSVLLGKAFGAFYHFKSLPISAGLRIGDFSYDHVRRQFDTGDGVQKTKNKIWIWTGVLRGELETNLPFDIYFEGIFGLRRYFMKTYSKYYPRLVIGGNDDDNTRFNRATLHSDWGMVYGGAVGAKIKLASNSEIALDLQLGYKQSGTGEFYIHDGLSGVADLPLDNYVFRRSVMSMLFFKMGLSLAIRPD
jgi:hypothetical protein